MNNKEYYDLALQDKAFMNMILVKGWVKERKYRTAEEKDLIAILYQGYKLKN